MIITDKFVMINFPKTGSTFVRKVFEIIHEKKKKKVFNWLTLFNKSSSSYQRIKVPNIRTLNARYLKDDEHGTVSQIPTQFQNNEIVSVKRNIFDYLVSLYEYGDWKKEQALWIDEAEVRKTFANFPNLSFQEFLSFIYSHSPHYSHPKIKGGEALGFLSALYIMFYAKKPFETFEKINNEGLNSCGLDDFAKITFLNQENLRIELYNFLLTRGYTKRRIEFIKTYPEQNKSSKTDRNYFTLELITFVKERESLLFKIMNAYEV